MLLPKRKRRILVLNEGECGGMHGKTGDGAVRYIPDQVVGVVDSVHAGRTTQQVIGAGGPIPIVRNMQEGLRLRPNALLIGFALRGGVLLARWRRVIHTAIRHRLDIINGLHTFLADDPALAAAARRYGVALYDLRRQEDEFLVAAGHFSRIKARVVLAVGADCAIGKMSQLLEIYRYFLERGKKAVYVGTGQTGMLICNRGVPVDAVKSDFVAGLVEREIVRAARTHDYIFVEGQGALSHQGYSAVTLGLMHGAMPDAMIFCHDLFRKRDDYGRPYRPTEELIDLHERVLAPIKRSRVTGVALRTRGYSDGVTRRAMAKMESRLGMPVDDCVRYGGETLGRALLRRLGPVRRTRHSRSPAKR